MAQTQRTLDQIYALLADNTTGAISPQDLRDAVATLSPGGADMYVVTPVETSIAAVNTWSPDASVYTFGFGVHWSMPTNGRMTYNGASQRACYLHAALSFTAAANNKLVEVGFLHNGAIVASSAITRRVGTGADVGAMSIVAIDPVVVAGDYFQVAVRNLTDNTNITIERCNFIAWDLPS